MNSDKSATRSGLVGRYLTVLDLKTSCRTLSAGARWTKTTCRGSRAPQPIRKCPVNHFSGIRAILILDHSSPSLNKVSRDKTSARARQADCLTNINPIRSRQKTCSSTTKNRLVCGSLNDASAERERVFLKPRPLSFWLSLWSRRTQDIIEGVWIDDAFTFGQEI